MADLGVDERTPSRRRRDDAAALLLILFGVTGLAIAAWLVDPRAGLAVASTALVVIGVVLGLDR